MADARRPRRRVLLLFVAMAAGALAALAAGVWLAAVRDGGFVLAGLVAGFGMIGALAWGWLRLDTEVARTAERVAAGLRAAQTDGGAPVTGELAPWLGDLAPAAEAVTRDLAETRTALASAVARETERLSGEKGRLEALLADVPVGVLLCTGAHEIVFYNGHAVDYLGAGHAPGLGRNLFDYLREGPVRHAYRRLAEAGDPDAASDVLCATRGAARVLAGRMRVLRRRTPEEAPGYVLTLRDVTAEIEAHTAREALLAELLDRVRRPAANLQTAIGVMAEAGGAAGAPDLGAALIEEVRSLTGAITELGRRWDEGRADWRPLGQTRSSDLMDSLGARLEAAGLALEVDAPDLILGCDGFEVVALFTSLAEHLAAEGIARRFRIALVEEDGPGASFALEWEGAPLAVAKLEEWLDAPLDPAGGELTGRAVLQTHGTEAWPEVPSPGRAAIRMPIRQARRAGRRPPPIARDVVYDFDLLSKSRAEGVAETRLEDLTYVVFDTETTGLDPKVDEIVQIAAVRLVNGRRVKGEVFETLVDPRRPIPPRSTDIHGITDSMVVGAPDAVEATARFLTFARGAVLVAHNAPFDLQFLRRHEAAAGGRFDQPMLDTVLLSAVVYGQQEEHSLDALAARLGITIPEEARHTAPGDTAATADAFLRLLAMLRARGMTTYGDLLGEMRRHGRLLTLES